ncbi:hypothetical protein BDW68DRAFT_154657 [Aspergillus falconensis]
MRINLSTWLRIIFWWAIPCSPTPKNSKGIKLRMTARQKADTDATGVAWSVRLTLGLVAPDPLPEPSVYDVDRSTRCTPRCTPRCATDG